MDRLINKIILHCADTRTDQNFNASDIDRWHKQRGWSEIGYHYVILLDGTIENGRDLDKIGAHCRGENKNSIGISFMGGRNPDGSKWGSPTKPQIKAYLELELVLSKKYPGITTHGHYEFGNKSCPNFEICKLYD